MTIYQFACPFPCSRVIYVDASDDDDAVRKIIKAGGLACRDEKNRRPCEIAHLLLSPLPDRQLKDLIRSTMILEDLPVVGDVRLAQGSKRAHA